MTPDGKSVIMGTNKSARIEGEGRLEIVSLDGYDVRLVEIPEIHHDLTVLPDGTVAYIEFEVRGGSKCDRIMELSPGGEQKEVYSLWNDFEHRAKEGEWCHSNALNYIPEEDVYYLSVLQFDSILKIDRATGTLLWVLNGDESDFTGTSWNLQHRFQLLDDSILLFSNGNSEALQYRLHGDTWEAELIWSHRSAANTTTHTHGDVHRFDNDNTLITYSNAGLIDEVTYEGEIVRQIILGRFVGYTAWRESLYVTP